MTIEGIDSSVVERLPYDLDPDLPDHIIIATALAVKERVPDRKVIMVSRDINLRVISDSIGLTSEDYIATTVIKDTTSLYSGFLKVLVDDEFVDQFYEGDIVFLEEEKVKCYANQLLMLVIN